MITKKELKKLVGKRLLIKERNYYGSIKEIKIDELSPSGKRIKIILMNGYTCWEDADKFFARNSPEGHEILEKLRCVYMLQETKIKEGLMPIQKPKLVCDSKDCGKELQDKEKCFCEECVEKLKKRIYELENDLPLMKKQLEKYKELVKNKGKKVVKK